MMDDFDNPIEPDHLSVHSGFPNPATDHGRPVMALNLNHLLVRRPESTYLFRVSGHSWSDQGLYDGDIALVDRSALERPNDLLIIWQGDDFRLIRRQHLTSDEKSWGVVSAVIHRF